MANKQTIEVGSAKTLHGRGVVVLSRPRWIAGGAVVALTWAEDNEAQRLADGSVHPAHRRGFMWEEPVCNIQG